MNPRVEYGPPDFNGFRPNTKQHESKRTRRRRHLHRLWALEDQVFDEME